jgi:predicted nucleotidyltransferase
VPRPATADLEALLRELSNAGVEFIVVGGAAAVIHGAPITTQDLDIVPRQGPGDLDRLLAVLTQLDARFRPVRPDRDIAPDASHLAGGGQLNLICKHGPLDILIRLHDTRGYDELLPHTCEIVDADLRVRVIDLDTLIEIKRSTGRARDALVVPLLLAIRARDPRA